MAMEDIKIQKTVNMMEIHCTCPDCGTKFDDYINVDIDIIGEIDIYEISQKE